MRLRLNGQFDAARLKCNIVSIRMHGLGAKLSSAKIRRARHVFTVHEVLEERKNVELRKGGHSLRSNKAENLLTGWGFWARDVLACEEGAEKRQEY